MKMLESYRKVQNYSMKTLKQKHKWKSKALMQAKIFSNKTVKRQRE
jgi:hypothetical protein